MKMYNNRKSKFLGALALMAVIAMPLQAFSAITTIEKNELRIVITPDYYPVIWMPAEKYGVDFTYDSTKVTTCSSSCSITADNGQTATYTSSRLYQVKSYVEVTVYYDANGKIVAIKEVDSTPPPPLAPPVAESEPSSSSAIAENFSGSLSVSPNGATNYSVGIDIPPGVAGMQPSIGLAYDSQAGKGTLGIGWGLTGLSEIGRCPRTVAEDGYLRGVDYTSADAYCFDGSRMVSMGGGEYRLKNSDDQKIVSVNGGFEVRSRSGAVAEYGLTNDSKIEAQGKTAVARWLINKVTDSHGNYYTYTYQEDNANGDYRIDRIDYTGNAATAPFASVRFQYNNMYSEDIDVSYLAGSKQSTLKMLKNIYTYYGDTLVKNYRFIYSYSKNANTRLSKIYECAGLYSENGDCKRPIEFTWNAESDSVFKPKINGLNTWVVDSYVNAPIDINRVKMGDFNGDGRTDIYYVRGWGSTAQDTVYISDGKGGYASKAGLNSWVTSNTDRGGIDVSRFVFGDYNGDGRLDIYYIQGWGSAERDYVYLANPDGSFGSGIPSLSLYVGSSARNANIDISRLKVGDFNGDGKSDIYYLKGWATTEVDALYLSNGNGTFSYKSGLNTWINKDDAAVTDISRFSVGDFNGDGMSDLYYVSGWGTSTADKIYMSTGGGSFQGKQSNIVTYVYNGNEGARTDISRLKFSDFNGDGLTDVYYVNGWGNAVSDSLYISKGDSTFAKHTVSGFQTVVTANNTTAANDIARIVPGDFDGDGKSEIYYINGWGSFFGIETNTLDYIYSYKKDGEFDKKLTGLNTFVNNNTQGASIDISRLKFGDFTGDGGLDIYQVNGWGTTTRDYIYPTALNSKLVVEKIADGFGNETTLDYEYLSEAGQTVYNRINANPGYALQSFQGPMRVVKSKTTTDGLDGTTTTVYKYEDARVDLQGRGHLGFAKTISTNTQTNLVTTVDYSQTYPYIGMVTNELQTLNGNNLSQTVNTPATFPLDGNGREMVYLSGKEIKAYSDNGTLISTVTTSNQINNNPQGNVTDVVVTTTDETGSGDIYVTTTHNDYAHSGSGNFYLESLVTASTVNKSGPQGTSPSVTQSFEYDTTGIKWYKLLSESGYVDDGITQHTGITKAYDYDIFGHINKTTITAPDIETRVVTSEYDPIGRFPIKVTNEMGHTATSTYDPVLGLVLTKADANGLVTTNIYDGWGRLTDVEAPGGNMTHTSTSWCEINCQLDAINTGVAAQTAKIVTTTSVTGGPSQLKYAPDVITYYDKLGREIRKQTTDFLGETILVDTAYDDLGRVVAQTQPYFVGDTKRVTTTGYDDLGRVTQTNVPGEGITTVEYFDTDFRVRTTQTYNDANYTSQQTRVSEEKKNIIGQVLYNTDNDGNRLFYAYDAQGNKVKTFLPTVDANGNTINNVDASGNVIEANSLVVQIDYDVFGRKTAMHDPNMGTWSYSYDRSSKLRTQTDALGQTTTMEYDRLGRMISRTDHDGRKSVWDYNDDLVNGGTPATMSIGKLDTVYQTDSTGLEEHRQVMTYTTDLGLPDTVFTIIEEGGGTPGSGKKVSYTTKTSYDEYHRPEKVSYPETSPDKRLELKYIYTEGALTEVQKPDGTYSYWRAEQANARGQSTLAGYADGAIKQTRGYDDAGRLTLLDYADSAFNALYNSQYDYNGLGTLVYRKTMRSNALDSLTEKYYYDTLQRLTSVEINGIANAQQYSYDILGNMRSKSGQGTYKYDGSQPHAVSEVNGGSYLYNNNGALTSGGGRSVTWSAFNKPAKIENQEGFSSFGYGPSRARYKQLSYLYADPAKAQTTIYVGGSYEKVTENGVTKHKHYIKVGGETIAQYTVTQTATDTVGTDKLEYLLRDNQGSTVAVTDASGAVTAEMDYDAFGARRPILNASTITSVINEIPRGYTGHEHLDRLGLIHMNGRVYDQALGRFLSADPVVQFSKNIQSYNRFSYVLNNPMSYTDPSGFSLKRLFKAVVTAAVAPIAVSSGVGMYTKPVRRAMMKYQWARIGLQSTAAFADGLSGCVGCFSSLASGYIADISGGSLGDVARAAVTSYLTAQAYAKIAHPMETTKDFWSVANMEKILVHGTIGGVSSEVSGGRFRDGFVGAAGGQIASLSGLYGALEIENPKGIDYLYNAVTATVVGGVVSKATGGDFESGALAALYGRMFNELRPEQVKDGYSACHFDDCMYKEVSAKPYGDIWYEDAPDQLKYIDVDVFGEAGDIIGFVAGESGSRNIEVIGFIIDTMYETKLGVFRAYYPMQMHDVTYHYIYPNLGTGVYRHFNEPRQVGPIKVESEPYKYDF